MQFTMAPNHENTPLSNTFHTPEASNSCINTACCDGGGNHVGGPTSKKNDRDDDTIDMKLAAEMNELSVKEREQALEELHGVAKEQEETPELLQTSMDELDKAIEEMPRSIRNALHRAIFLRPEIQKDAKFKLQFLRADYFDAQKAARRMAYYFSHKLRLFGEEKLPKTLTLEDLEEHDIQILKSGFFKRLPQVDPIGRPVIFITATKLDLSDKDSMMRAVWYFLTTSYNDEGAQKKGIVHIAYIPVNLLSLPYPPPYYGAHFRRVKAVMDAIPLRSTAYHFCYNDPGLRLILNGIQRNLGKIVRLRTRPHFGSPVELQYSLMTYGLSYLEPFFLVNDKAQAVVDSFYRKRQEEEKKDTERMEQEEAKTSIIVYPKQEDVLIGRGFPYHHFPGTCRLLDIIERESDRYYQSKDKFSKTCIAMDMVARVKEWNGRFLYRTDGVGWNVYDDVTARGKVANLFYYHKKKDTQDSKKRSKKS